MAQAKVVEYFRCLVCNRLCASYNGYKSHYWAMHWDKEFKKGKRLYPEPEVVVVIIEKYKIEASHDQN